MSSVQTLFLILVIVVIAVVAVVVFGSARRRALQEKFGDEYERLVDEHHSKSAAEKELRERERRHAELQLRELSPEVKDRYSERWQDVQALFVDEPREAVRQADALVTEIAGDIGYPTEDDADKEAQLSVDHSQTLSAYRRAKDIAVRADADEVDTDQLRQAIVDYRELVAALLGASPVPAVDETPKDETPHP
ncbi:hypothetical protein [Hamadaea tsunoensis]|uniref:hypothetical protein n=1 Tax=Hamadaea tsunoensis TaxID=53368 RepID=UPI0003FA503E|nr:hypothetical protein [Hamadaea tsunoensis]